MAKCGSLDFRPVSHDLHQELDRVSTISSTDSWTETHLGEPCSSQSEGSTRDEPDSTQKMLACLKPHFYTSPNPAGDRKEEVNQPSKPLKGILKSCRTYSDSEKAVEDILDLLLTSASSASSSWQLQCAKDLFPNLCFDEFFQMGECLSSSCELNHSYRTFIFDQDPSNVWFAALYVIYQAPIPCVKAIKNLVHFFSDQPDLARTLALAKCIPKVKFTDRLELADYMVNRLSQLLGRRDIITQILILSFSDLQTHQFNELMEGLGVFKSSSAQFSDLIQFLNYRNHQFPNNLLVKLMKDATQCYWPESSFTDSVVGFVGRVLPEDLEELRSVNAAVVDEFLIKFGPIRGPSKLPSLIGRHLGLKQKQHMSNKKRVKFNANLQEVKIIEPEPALPTALLNTETPTNDSETPLCAVEALKGDILESVFGNTCPAWVVQGSCQKNVCTFSHDFPKDSLKDKKPEDVFMAMRFIVDQSIHPDIRLLKEFVNFAALCKKEVRRVLQFRKCIPRMDRVDGESLTELILAQLSQDANDIFEAVEMVMIPNLLEVEKENDREQFPFRADLLESIMKYAVEKKTTICTRLKEEIVNRWSLLPPSGCESSLETLTSFMDKFFLGSNFPEPIPDDQFPVPTCSKFSSSFKVALFTGAESKFFVGCTLLKFALEHDLAEIAADDLYSFLLGQFARAQILRDMLDTSIYFSGRDRKSIRDLLGNVAIRLCVHFYENESLSNAAQIFLVLRKHQLNILDLQLQSNIPQFDLAVMYCSLVVDFHPDEGLINAFLDHCLKPFLDSAYSPASVPNKLITLTDKLFSVLCRACANEELLQLFNEIFSRQNSLVCPLNLIEHYEPTLRCTFRDSFVDNIREKSLKLYYDVAQQHVDVNFQKVTYRSLFMITLTEVHFQHDKVQINTSRLPNFFCPQIRQLLMKCMDQGVYPKMASGDHITLFSSMSHEELKIYSLWWFCLFLRAKKRKNLGYFYAVTVNIVQDNLLDGLNLPIHPSLQTIDPSIAACASRLLTVWGNMMDDAFDRSSMFRHVKPGVYELRPDAVASISEAVLCLKIDYNLIHTTSDPVTILCSLCFDVREDLVLADNI